MKQISIDQFLTPAEIRKAAALYKKLKGGGKFAETLDAEIITPNIRTHQQSPRAGERLPVPRLRGGVRFYAVRGLIPRPGPHQSHLDPVRSAQRGV